jgi:hypothetical protein
MTVKIKLENINGSLVQNKTYVPTRSGAQTIKLTGASGSLVSYPTNVPSISTAAINDLLQFPNTATVLAFDAVTYANAVNFVTNNYTNTDSLQINTLNDIEVPPTIANNSTLVYDTTTNKYIVKTIDLDGGNF